ncbi:purine and uridine phosphorylase, partial [Aureobasidium melanogenum]
MRPETRDEFEIAIVCALPLEAAAVIDSFDQRYDKNCSGYGKQEGDTNTYSTGRIGQHNVVLAHMPGMGVSSAASVASNIQLSFKGIRLALIVGVCGGAPLERPTPAIVLGDVIISNSVVEFDFGKQYPTRFERKTDLDHTLGRPNPEIRGLLSKFGVASIRKELEETILQNLNILQQKGHTAGYPGAEHDRLFPASYRHIHRRETASQDCPCVSSQSDGRALCLEALESSCDALGCIVKIPDGSSRQLRFASGNPTPFVHIGTIGSASTVMKSGEHRDIIARENKIIAFEMEGAGVWDNLPCIVVKGVCDYSDSHKNKMWQNYAAATAASATKAFLDHWTPRQHNIIPAAPSRKRRRSCSPEDDYNASHGARRPPRPERQKAVASALPLTDQTSTGLPAPWVLADPHAQKITLDALNFEHLDARQATIKTAHTATCEWLFNQSEYLDWQNEDKTTEHHGFLWIKGKPGAGKSTIMKFAYTNANEISGGSVVISYFFNARGEHLEKSTVGMYRSLLFQLLSKVPRLQEILDTNEATNLQTVSPELWTTETLQLLFCQAIEKLEEQRLICFVDALDECENNEDQVREMVRFFEALGECATMRKTRFHVCFSSRHYPHITIDKCVELVLEAQQGHSEDITKYINSKLKVGRSKRAEHIKSEMHANAQGVFLWVVLVVPILQKAYDHGRVHALSECLKGIPKGLDELFEDILQRDTENMENLKACLKWILYSDRPLSPTELYLAILSASSSAPATAWDPEDITIGDINRFILSSSKGLAETTRGKIPTIQFIHESVRDFLLKGTGSALHVDIGLVSAGLVHDFLKHSCQRYLASIPSSLVSTPTDSSKDFVRENETNFPFLSYSIRYIFKHAESAASLGVSQERFLEVFPLAHWILLHDCTEKYKIRHYGHETTLLYILTERNFLNLSQIEICRSQSVNAKGGRYDFPIIAAAVVGNDKILDLLLRYGADHTKRGKEYRHALHAAVDKLHPPAVAMLIDRGAVPASKDSIPPRLIHQVVKLRELTIMRLLLKNRSLLPLRPSSAGLVETAIDNSHQEMLELFLEFGVVSTADNYNFIQAFRQASWDGNEDLVRVLIGLDADVNVAGRLGTALEAASRAGHEAVVRLLIEKGVDVNAVSVGQSGRSTALYAASASGQQAIVSILLEHGADVNAASVEKSGKSSTALYAASASGEKAIVSALLKHGADVNAVSVEKSGKSGTALYAASGSGEQTIVSILLEHGADVNAASVEESGKSSTALYAASGSGEQTIVSILLEHGADVNEACPLYAASYNGHEAVVRLLVEAGADVNALHVNAFGQNSTALYAVSASGQQTIVSILLEHGADINEACSLYAASYNGHKAVVRSLINAGADVNAMYDNPDGARRTVLYTAAASGQQPIVDILLEHGADVNKACPLYAASSFEHETITRTLLEHGADPNQADVPLPFRTRYLPLHAALERGHLKIVRLLLDFGAVVNMSSSMYADAFTALEDCRDQEKRAACKQLLLERHVVDPHALYLT